MQLDVFRDDPRRIAAAWRVAAQTALLDTQFTDDERKQRHDYYLAGAEKIEAGHIGESHARRSA